jgi:hypothetical protein
MICRVSAGSVECAPHIAAAELKRRNFNEHSTQIALQIRSDHSGTLVLRSVYPGPGHGQ